MNNKKVIIDIVTEQRLLPLYYHPDREVSVMTMKALYDSGVRLIEWTNRGENALENFIYLKNISASTMPGLHLGAGTIKTRSQALDYIKAGADFIVCPCIIEEVAETVNEYDLLWIPGCMTPTEIAKAEMAGASLVKIFPAHLLGPLFIKAIKELFPSLMFMPTGGIEPDAKSLQQWFDAGVTAVGMGSTLIGKKLIEEKKYSVLTDLAKQVLAHIKEIKKE